MQTARRVRGGRAIVGNYTETPASDTPGTATVVAESTGVDPGPITLAVGATFQLDVLGTDLGNGDVLTGFSEAWATSNAGVATVSVTGLVTGVGSGNATISCTITKNAVSATDSLNSAVTVSAPVVLGMTSTPTAISVTVGSTTTITYQATDGINGTGNAVSGQTYTATSSNTGIATVNVVGNVATVTGVAAGSCTITGHVPAASVDGSAVGATVSTASTAWPDEPAGLTTIFEHACDLQLPTTEGGSGANTGVYKRESSYNQANAVSLTDASVGLTAPYGDGNLWRFRWPAAQRAGTGATFWRGWKTTLGTGRPTYDTFYYSFWFNIYGNGTNIEMTVGLAKVFGFLGYGADLGTVGNQGYWTIGAALGFPTQVSLSFKQQGAVSRSVPGSKALLINTWYQFQLLATSNLTIGAGGTGAVSDGTLKQWITLYGGAKTLFCNRTDMAWKVTGAANPFHGITWNNTYGGTGTDKTRIDDVFVAHIRGSGA